EAFCTNVGMSMTTAFTVFAKKVISERRIPFEISDDTDPFYNPANIARLERAVADLNAGKGKTHELIEVDGGDD
nr:type II toxin-antitoxin system RelB/DinJ family antitoxin [Clostridia bacterium]